MHRRGELAPQFQQRRARRPHQDGIGIEARQRLQEGRIGQVHPRARAEDKARARQRGEIAVGGRHGHADFPANRFDLNRFTLAQNELEHAHRPVEGLDCRCRHDLPILIMQEYAAAGELWREAETVLSPVIQGDIKY